MILLPLAVQPLLAAARTLQREIAALASDLPIVILASAVRSAGRARASARSTAAHPS